MKRKQKQKINKHQSQKSVNVPGKYYFLFHEKTNQSLILTTDDCF